MQERAPTGIDGLDHVLMGGLPRNRLYLIEGDPGVGKTTIALQFLLAGLAAGERTLYVTLSETKDEIDAVARSHGWSLDGVAMFELSALEQLLTIDAENTIFRSSDVELGEITQVLQRRIDEVMPDRLVFDSLSELRLLSQNALRYRREVLSLKTFFSTKKCTVLLLDDRTSEPSDQQLQSIAHGVITVEQLAPEYGGDRRRLRIAKLRGAPFRSGYHDVTIETGGVQVYPRLVAAEHKGEFQRTALPSGLAELDALLGGGVDRGTSTLVLGNAGTGKSSVVLQYACAVAARGERAAIFAFDELRATATHRAEALGLNIREHLDSGRVRIQQIDPAELSPGQLSHLIMDLTEREGFTFIAIDTLNGYLHSMPSEHHLYLQLHELLSYLGQRGVTTMMVLAQSGAIREMQSPVDISYIADNVLLLRFFEAQGRIRKAISVVKKRTGRHEDTIRELSLDSTGLHVGAPLVAFQGVLTGVPVYHGHAIELEQDGQVE
ncbi:MAG TPA: ATPase domain-containing protein [Kofleriaceae bacterium]|jgi:circadian clock protein KaiC